MDTRICNGMLHVLGDMVSMEIYSMVKNLIYFLDSYLIMRISNAQLVSLESTQENTIEKILNLIVPEDI